jgi:hypothetical protein
MAKKSNSAGRRKERRDASTRKEERRYPIAPDHGEICLRRGHPYYVTGTTASGEQGIIINSVPLMHAYWFDREGEYLRQESREVSGLSADKPYLKQLRDRLKSLRAWVKELGLTPGTIHVKRFHSDGRPPLSIRDYPLGWDGAEWGEGESLEGMLEWWQSLGAFVLFWNGFEYNIDKEGNRFQ